MYSEKLENLIDAIVASGELDDAALSVLNRTAKNEGEDPEEILVIVRGRIAKAKQASPASEQPAMSDKIGGHKKKCPACGADYIPGTAVCPECGYVFSGIGTTRSADRLYEELQKFNNANQTKSGGGILHSYLKMYNLADDGISDIARRKMDIIQSFPIPNSREDLIDFLSSLQPKADINGPKTGTRGGGPRGLAFGKDKTEDLSYAYWVLFSNCINKARMSFAADKDFIPFFDYYDEVTSKKGFTNIFRKR